MIQDAPSKTPAPTNRYRVARPTRQRFAGWVALGSAATIPLLIWFASLPPHRQGVLAVVLQQPFMGLLIVFAAVSVLFLISLASAAYWMKIEHASDSFPWRQTNDEPTVNLHHSRGKWHS